MSKTSPSMIRFAILRCALACAIGAVAVAGCATAGAGGGSSAAPSSREVITAAELENTQATTLYDAIRNLRPAFLKSDQAGVYGSLAPVGNKTPAAANAQSSTQFVPDAVAPIMVYKDGVRLSGVDDLKQIMTSTVKEVQHLKGPQAAVRFGTNNAAGAIIVTSK